MKNNDRLGREVAVDLLIPDVCFQRFGANRVKTESGWQHQSFLRTSNRDVNAPLIMAVIDLTQ